MNGIDDGQIEALIEKKIQELFSELAKANNLRMEDIGRKQKIQLTAVQMILTNVVIHWILQNKDE